MLVLLPFDFFLLELLKDESKIYWIYNVHFLLFLSYIPFLYPYVCLSGGFSCLIHLQPFGYLAHLLGFIDQQGCLQTLSAQAADRRGGSHFLLPGSTLFTVTVGRNKGPGQGGSSPPFPNKHDALASKPPRPLASTLCSRALPKLLRMLTFSLPLDPFCLLGIFRVTGSPKIPFLVFWGLLQTYTFYHLRNPDAGGEAIVGVLTTILRKQGFP